MFNIFKRRKTDPDFVATLSWKRRRMHKKQRIERGWSEIDAMNGDKYFAKLICEMVEHHKTLEYIPGLFLPVGFKRKDKKAVKEALSAWNKILDDISIPLKKYYEDVSPDTSIDEEMKIIDDAKIAMHLFAEYSAYIWY